MDHDRSEPACHGKECPVRKSCLRFKDYSNVRPHRMYFTDTPGKLSTGGWVCEKQIMIVQPKTK